MDRSVVGESWTGPWSTVDDGLLLGYVGLLDFTADLINAGMETLDICMDSCGEGADLISGWWPDGKLATL